MLTQSSRSLLNLRSPCRVIPVVESRLQFVHVLESAHAGAIFLRRCNLFEFVTLLERAQRSGYSVYVNMDHIDGIEGDAAGLRYLAQHLRVTGIVSVHPKILSLGKSFDLETIQRIYVVDSTGLENALESVDPRTVDLLDLSPALVIPYVIPSLKKLLPLPFVGSGLIFTVDQVQAVLSAGAVGVAVLRPELWP